MDCACVLGTTVTFVPYNVVSEDKIQEELEGCKKIKHIFDKISSRMRSAGFDRSTEQCRLKVKKLRAEYKKIRDGNKKTGEDRKDWKHFDALDTILGSKPSTEPLIVVDTLAGHCDDVQPFTVEDKGEDGEESDEVVVGETEMLGTSQSSISTANLDCVEDEKVDVKKERNIGKNKGKKRMSRDDRLENATDSVMTKMMEKQSKTDELFLELKTKRMKMEEQMYEMEQRRVKEERERQERERREEREFQLKLYSMICGTNHPMHNSQLFPPSHHSDSPYQFRPYLQSNAPTSPFSHSFQSSNPTSSSPLFPITRSSTPTSLYQSFAANASDTFDDVDHES